MYGLITSAQTGRGAFLLAAYGVTSYYKTEILKRRLNCVKLQIISIEAKVIGSSDILSFSHRAVCLSVLSKYVSGNSKTEDNFFVQCFGS